MRLPDTVINKIRVPPSPKYGGGFTQVAHDDCILDKPGYYHSLTSLLTGDPGKEVWLLFDHTSNPGDRTFLSKS